MDRVTVRDVLDHLDTIIEYLTYHDDCCSALDIALELKEDIMDSAYNDD
jgi:hypothetical protein